MKIYVSLFILVILTEILVFGHEEYTFKKQNKNLDRLPNQTPFSK